jgi:SulP family sulfate permease
LSVLHLQGFLFFGTANGLLDRVRQRLEQSGREAIRYLLLDFRRVTGLDSTALLSFTKMKQVAQANNLVLVFCDLDREIHQQMAAGGLFLESPTIETFDDLDSALEWCEDRLLEAAGCRPDEPLPPLPQQLADLMADDTAIESLLPYLQRVTLPAGSTLIRQGDTADALYFLESGQLSAQLRQENGEILRLETMLGGRVVGELGFYLGTARSADVVVDSSSVVYRLTRTDLERMERENPEVASEFHRLIIRLLSERVTHLVSTVEGLQR